MNIKFPSLSCRVLIPALMATSVVVAAVPAQASSSLLTEVAVTALDTTLGWGIGEALNEIVGGDKSALELGQDSFDQIATIMADAISTYQFDDYTTNAEDAIDKDFYYNCIPAESGYDMCIGGAEDVLDYALMAANDFEVLGLEGTAFYGLMIALELSYVELLAELNAGAGYSGQSEAYYDDLKVSASAAYDHLTDMKEQWDSYASTVSVYWKGWTSVDLWTRKGKYCFDKFDGSTRCNSYKCTCGFFDDCSAFSTDWSCKNVGSTQDDTEAEMDAYLDATEATLLGEGFSDLVARIDQIADLTWFKAGHTMITSGWGKLYHYGDYVDPVVIIGPPSYEESDGVVVRIKNVNANTLNMMLDEWDYLDGSHGFEEISWMVVEAGVHVADDGTTWEAGTFSASSSNNFDPTAVAFQTTFASTPLVFVTIQTTAGSTPVTARVSDVSVDGFSVWMQEEEAINDGHSTETIGYVAISGSPSSHAGYSFASDTVSVSDSWTSVPGTSYQLSVQEEQSANNETGHSHESVNVLKVGSDVGDLLFAQDVSTAGTDCSVLRRQ